MIIFASIVNYNLSNQNIIIRNDIDLLIIFIKHARLDKMLKYETKKYFQIDLKHVSLINRSFKKIKSKFLIKQIIKESLYIITIFNIIIIFNIEIVYYIDVIIYENLTIIIAIINVTKTFFNL